MQDYHSENDLPIYFFYKTNSRQKYFTYSNSCYVPYTKCGNKGL